MRVCVCSFLCALSNLFLPTSYLPTNHLAISRRSGMPLFLTHTHTMPEFVINVYVSTIATAAAELERRKNNTSEKKGKKRDHRSKPFDRSKEGRGRGKKKKKKEREKRTRKRLTRSLSLHTYVAKRHHCTPGVGCCYSLSLSFSLFFFLSLDSFFGQFLHIEIITKQTQNKELLFLLRRLVFVYDNPRMFTPTIIITNAE